MNATAEEDSKNKFFFRSPILCFFLLFLNMRLDFIQHENHIFSAPTFCAFVGGSKVHEFLGHLIGRCGLLGLSVFLTGRLSHADTRNVASIGVQNKMAHLEKMCKQFHTRAPRKKKITPKKRCCFSLLRYQNAINFRWWKKVRNHKRRRHRPQVKIK